MKIRLRADLLTAMKGRRPNETSAIRSLIAAIDNADAPLLDQTQSVAVTHAFEQRSAEVARLRLDWAQFHFILNSEIGERDRAATEYERLGKQERAAASRAEVTVIQRHLT